MFWPLGSSLASDTFKYNFLFLLTFSDHLCSEGREEKDKKKTRKTGNKSREKRKARKQRG